MNYELGPTFVDMVNRCISHFTTNGGEKRSHFISEQYPSCQPDAEPFYLSFYPLPYPPFCQAEEDGDPSIGIALNGGSLTAANGCASVLRGFQQQQIKRDGKDRPAMEAFDLVSGLSGGNMPNIQYHYATYTDSNTVLDASGINDPTEITVAELDSIPMKSMFKSYVNQWFPSVLLAIIHATLFGGPIWPEAV